MSQPTPEPEERRIVTADHPTEVPERGGEARAKVHPIEDAAQSLLFRLAEQTEDIMDEACSELWPGGWEDWFAPPLNSPELPRYSFSEHTYAAVMRRFSELIRAAADAAERRAGPRPVEWKDVGRV